jgi:hypothetical protein
LSFEDDTDRPRKSDPQPEEADMPAPRSRKRRAANGEVGQALRAAYKQAIEEDIPPEMLDLLGKLG